jgi:four helix bundle protein
MSKITRFEDMQLWKDAVGIGVDVYRLTSRGKLRRDFAAIDQLRRAAISISNNIAEGFEYNGNRFFIRFLRYAKGSAGELRSNLFVLKEAEILPSEDYYIIEKKLIKISSDIKGFMNYLDGFEERK